MPICSQTFLSLELCTQLLPFETVPEQRFERKDSFSGGEIRSCSRARVSNWRPAGQIWPSMLCFVARVMLLF